MIDAIAGFDPALAALFSEREEEYETILSTLLMADVAGWATERYQAGHHESVSEFFALLEQNEKPRALHELWTPAVDNGERQGQ